MQAALDEQKQNMQSDAYLQLSNVAKRAYEHEGACTLYEVTYCKLVITPNEDVDGTLNTRESTCTAFLQPEIILYYRDKSDFLDYIANHKMPSTRMQPLIKAGDTLHTANDRYVAVYTFVKVNKVEMYKRARSE